jgi:hypothetical protein
MRACLLLLLGLGACGGATTGDGTPATIPGQPPPRPAAADTVPAGTTTTTFAVNAWLLGESSRSGEAASGAWRSYGYDLDHRATTKDSSDVCSLSLGSPRYNQADGDFGIDNGWGSVLLPILQSALSLPTPSVTADTALAHGVATLDLEVTGLPDDASASAVGLRAGALVTAPVTADPFDASVPRPVDAKSVVDGATLASGPRVVFGDAYVNHGTFVSGPSSAPLTIELPVSVPALELTVRDAIVTFDRTSDPNVVSGTIAGVLDTDAVVASASAIAAAFDPGVFCVDPTQFDGIAAQIRQARDILDDATNRSGTPCTGISIGLGFTAVRVANPTSAQDVTPSPSPCN